MSQATLSQATVRIPAPLRPMAGGSSEVAVEGATVGDALADLGRQHGGVTERILDPSGQLRAFVNLYLDDKNIRSLGGLDIALPPGAILHIVPAVAGGGR